MNTENKNDNISSVRDDRDRGRWSSILLPLLLIGLLYAGIRFFNNVREGDVDLPGGAPNTAITGTNNDQRFTDLDISRSAYQIFPGPMSENARNALKGYNLQSQTQPDGSTIVTISSDKPDFITETFTVRPGQTLYFIDMNPNDDNMANNVGEQYGVLVDENGFVIQP